MQSIRKLLQLNTIPELTTFNTATRKSIIQLALASWRFKTVLGLLSLFYFAIFSPILSKIINIALHIYDSRLFIEHPLLGIFSATSFIIVVLFPLSLPILLFARHLIRRRIRSLLSQLGACPNCDYQLSGSHLSLDNSVKCPECGHTVQLDSSLSESTIDTQNRPIFNPRIPRPNERGIRRRRFVKRLIFRSAIVIITLTILIASSWLLFIQYQAAVAFRERDGSEQWVKLIADAQPIPGAHPSTPLPANPTIEELNDRNLWDEYIEILQNLETSINAFLAAHQDEFRNTKDVPPEFIDFTAVSFPKEPANSRLSPAEYETQQQDRLIQNRLAIAMIDSARREGLFDNMEQFSQIDVAMRPALPSQKSSEALIDLMISTTFLELRPARYVGRLCSARMSIALQPGNQQEYLDALDQGLAVARICDAQATIIEHLVGTAIDDLLARTIQSHLDRLPDQQWIHDIQMILVSRSRTIPLSHSILGEKIWAQDAIQYFFAQPRNVIKTTFAVETISAFAPSVPGSKLPLGTYRHNMNDIAACWDALAASSDASPQQRAISPVKVPNPQYRLTEILEPGVASANRSELSNMISSRGILLLLAIRHYQLRTGSLPATLADLTSEDLPSPMPLDPYSGQPFKYKLIDPASDPHHRSFLLYSVGPDLNDDGSNDSNLSLYQVLHSTTKGVDAVINQPVE